MIVMWHANSGHNRQQIQYTIHKYIHDTNWYGVWKLAWQAKSTLEQHRIHQLLKKTPQLWTDTPATIFRLLACACACWAIDRLTLLNTSLRPRPVPVLLTREWERERGRKEDRDWVSHNGVQCIEGDVYCINTSCTSNQQFRGGVGPKIRDGSS